MRGRESWSSQRIPSRPIVLAPQANIRRTLIVWWGSARTRSCSSSRILWLSKIRTIRDKLARARQALRLFRGANHNWIWSPQGESSPFRICLRAYSTPSCDSCSLWSPSQRISHWIMIAGEEVGSVSWPSKIRRITNSSKKTDPLSSVKQSRSTKIMLQGSFFSLKVAIRTARRVERSSSSKTA
jgi:hypothetical protein